MLVRRTVLAAVGAATAQLGGLAFLPSWSAVVVCAIVPGVLAGLVAPSPRRAVGAVLSGGAITALLGLTLGFSGPAPFWAAAIGGCVAAAATAAGIVLLLARETRRTSATAVGISLVVLLAAMWSAGLQGAGASSVFPFDAEAIERDSSANGLADYHLYLQTHVLMNQGTPYYEALVDASRHLRPGVPTGQRAGALGFRQPLLYWLWGIASPRSGYGIPVLFLCFGTIATLGAYALSATYVRRALALVGATAVAALFAVVAGSPLVLFHEFWAAALMLASLAFAARALASRRNRWLVIAAVVFAALAALVREHAAIVIVGGLAAWWLATESERDRKERWCWLAAAAVFAWAFSAHLEATGREVFSSSMGSSYLHLQLERPIRTLLFGSYLFVGRGAPWLAMALAGSFGPLLLRGASRRLLAISVTALAIIVSVLGPTGFETAGLVAYWYWGGLAVPLALACSPLAFLLMSESRRPTYGNRRK